MSQHDLNIANQGFPATRADLNNALAALASNSSGTSEPSTTYANQLWYDTSNDLLKFRNEADSAWIDLAYMNQTTSEWEIRSGVVQAVDSGGILFKTDEGTTRVTLDDSGNLLPLDASVSLGGASNRFSDGYFSGGVYLGGTGSANKLEDYEYGFFEPEFGGDVSDPTVTYDGTVGNEGWYVKVGRLVFIQINIRTDSVSGGSGAVVIRNLPFVTPNLDGQGGMGSFTIGYADDWAGERPIAGTISEGVTYINLSHRSAVDGNNIATNITDLGAGTNANLIRLSGTYYTTA